MALNRELVGKTYGVVSLAVTSERVDAFARAIGEGSPLFLDTVAAQSAGYPGQVAPPTFTTTLQFIALRQLAADPDLGLDFSRVLHGDQEFEWRRPVVVGDELTTSPRIVAIRGKGAMEALVVETEISDASGSPVVTIRGTLIVRGGD